MYPRPSQAARPEAQRLLPASSRALSETEREVVLETLNGSRFMNGAPREAYGTLLSEGLYLCHWRTMYRILEQHQQVRERRDQLRHPVYQKPQLLARSPNQVWTWDVRHVGAE